MTECERIIKEGILPETFFKPETICDFYVDENRKKLWAINIDMFFVIYDLCKKHNLRIFADGGTLLGAVRHQGFIPWDDDMDFVMPREDYDILCEIAPKELKDPYFFQTPQTDSNYFFSFAKLRNTNTTGMPMVHTKAGYNAGLSIDIFPLDFVNPDTYMDDRKSIEECVMICASYMKRNNIEDLTDKQKLVFDEYYRNENPIKFYDKIQAIASNKTYNTSPFVGNVVVTMLKPFRNVWKKEWYDSIQMLDFEGFKIPCPSNIDERLQKQYGDWKAFPPVQERGTWHTNEIIDTDRSYKEYL